MSRFSSALYQGRVRHTRLRPFHHTFSYRVFYWLFDIDELDRLDRELRWFSLHRFNLFGFDPGGHGPADGSPLRPWVDSSLRAAGVELDGGKVRLLAFPKVLGYVFNPLSIWYCHGPEGDLRAVIHEVRNTFGDRHSYVVPIRSGGLRHGFAKNLHVSPFNDMHQHYSFAISRPGHRLTVSIDQTDDDGEIMRAAMALTRVPLSDGYLLRLFLTHPLLTAKVIVAIHWEALKLKLKGATFHARPEPAARSISIVRPRNVIT